MPYLEQIIGIINTNYIENVFKDFVFSQNKIYGLTQPVTRTVGDKIETIPGLLLNDEFVYVGPDDEEALIIYHKADNSAYSLVANSSYGGSNGNQKATTDVSMIVFGQRLKLAVSQYELESLVNQNLPEKISKAKLTELKLISVNINASGSDVNMQRVFNNEFKNIAYFLNERSILFEYRYRIEATYKKDCFPNC